VLPLPPKSPSMKVRIAPNAAGERKSKFTREGAAV